MNREHTIGAVVALLEVTASGNPRLIDYQLYTILNGPARSAIYDLASAFDVAHDQVGQTVHRACLDLDRLERRRGTWRDPAEVLGSPNLAALSYVCHARLERVVKLARERKLEGILRKVERAHELARSRAWIEAFIGESPPRKRPAAENAGSGS